MDCCCDDVNDDDDRVRMIRDRLKLINVPKWYANFQVYLYIKARFKIYIFSPIKYIGIYCIYILKEYYGRITRKDIICTTILFIIVISAKQN
jgi:hypothetical protein